MGAGTWEQGSSIEGAAQREQPGSRRRRNQCVFFESLRITEMHIPNFWGMINMTDKLSPRDKVMMLPPSGRVRCLQALVAEIEAAQPP